MIKNGFLIPPSSHRSFFPTALRPLKNVQLPLISRKTFAAGELTAGIYGIFRGLNFESDTEIRRKGTFINGLIFVFMISVWLLTGCAAYQRLPDEKEVTPEARDLIDRLDRQNITLTHFKCLVTYRLKGPRGLISGRMGWACIRPDRFRTDIFDFSGRPHTTIASDGQWLYARIRGENKIKKKSVRGTTIKHIIGTPVSAKDMIAFLSGRIPIQAYRSAQVRTSHEQGPVLVLKGKWNRLIEEVYFHKQTLSPRRMAIYTDSGATAYQVDIGPRFTQKGYSFFQTLAFKDGQQNALEMTLKKLWLVENLPASIFKLELP